MKQEKLKSCPFCAGNVALVDGDGDVWVECGTCGAQTIKYHWMEQDMKKYCSELAMDVWNSRREK